MKASELMTTAVTCCGPDDSLQRAAQIMWEDDCGAVPVVDGDRRVVGIITDRDICMAAYIQGAPLGRIPVSSAMAKTVYSVSENDSIDLVEAVMRRAQVRRVPVHDLEGQLTGILSMNDLARHTHRTAGRKADGLSNDSIVKTLAAICEPHNVAPKKKPTTTNPAPVTA